MNGINIETNNLADESLMNSNYKSNNNYFSELCHNNETNEISNDDEDNNTEDTKTKQRKKVTQACENCRKKRRKCTGERPKCLTCQQYNYICYYNPFPKKRGPQQKKKKRKYKRRDKGEKTDITDENSLTQYCYKYNYLVMRNFLRNKTEMNNDIKITTNIYNDYLSYNDTLFFNDKINNNNIAYVGSELINYVLINYYYKYFHPIYPIVNYNSFAIHAKNGTLSKQLLFAMYGVAYFMEPNFNMSKATEYINKSKSLISQNYGNANVQLLQTLCLVSIFELGNDQSYLYNELGIRLIKNSSSYFINLKKNSYIIKEDIEDMKNISLILLGYDTWFHIIYRNIFNNDNIRHYINSQSKLLLCLTSGLLTSDYKYFVICINLFVLEIIHIAQKIRTDNFNIEDIDCINMDILRTQYYFVKNMDNMSMVIFNDIADDFSYYLEFSEASNENYRKRKSMHLSNTMNKQNKNIDDGYIKQSSDSSIEKNYNDSGNSQFKNTYNFIMDFIINNSSNDCSCDSSDNNERNDRNNTINKDSDKNDNSFNTFNNDNNDDSYNRNFLLNIIKSISQDENFFNINHHFLGNKKLNKRRNIECKSSFDFYKIIFLSPKDFIEKRKWSSFFINTMGQRIYINLIFIHFIFNNPQKMKLFPIAKSIAIVSKTADDISMLIKILLEAAELNSSTPLRFPYHKAWTFYQCCIVYVVRYIATQEKNYIIDNSSTRYSIFSKFPQKTLAPCYFYLDLLKEMRNYFVNVEQYIREIKLLIFNAKKSIKERTFQINIPDILQ